MLLPADMRRCRSLLNARLSGSLSQSGIFFVLFQGPRLDGNFNGPIGIGVMKGINYTDNNILHNLMYKFIRWHPFPVYFNTYFAFHSSSKNLTISSGFAPGKIRIFPLSVVKPFPV